MKVLISYYPAVSLKGEIVIVCQCLFRHSHDVYSLPSGFLAFTFILLFLHFKVNGVYLEWCVDQGGCWQTVPCAWAPTLGQMELVLA